MAAGPTCYAPVEHLSTSRPRELGVMFDVNVQVGLNAPSPARGAQGRAGESRVAPCGVDLGHPTNATAPFTRVGRQVLLKRQSDERLIELARAGDRRAFDVIAERYRSRLVAHCSAIVGEAGAQDAVQQALMSAWCALARGPDVRHVRAWLFTIAHRAALQIVRDQGVPMDELPEMLTCCGSLEDELEQSARARATLAAVAELPPRERDALVWTSIQGRSGGDIARSLGISAGSVRQLVFRARARARAAVDVVLPPVFVARAGALVGHAARRLTAPAHRVFGGGAPVQMGDALARLAPVLAASVLVGVPLGAVRLTAHHRLPAPAALSGSAHLSSEAGTKVFEPIARRPHDARAAARSAPMRRRGSRMPSPPRLGITRLGTSAQQVEGDSLGAPRTDPPGPAQTRRRERAAAALSGAASSAPGPVVSLPRLAVGTAVRRGGVALVVGNVASVTDTGHAAGQSATSGVVRVGRQVVETAPALPERSAASPDSTLAPG
jgi:RNA polymerase sigma factor (sigma-70 family)